MGAKTGWWTTYIVVRYRVKYSDDLGPTGWDSVVGHFALEQDAKDTIVGLPKYHEVEVWEVDAINGLTLKWTGEPDIRSEDWERGVCEEEYPVLWYPANLNKPAALYFSDETRPTPMRREA